jgi:hypothetical protein
MENRVCTRTRKFVLSVTSPLRTPCACGQGPVGPALTAVRTARMVPVAPADRRDPPSQPSLDQPWVSPGDCVQPETRCYSCLPPVSKHKHVQIVNTFTSEITIFILSYHWCVLFNNILKQTMEISKLLIPKPGHDPEPDQSISKAMKLCRV